MRFLLFNIFFIACFVHSSAQNEDYEYLGAAQLNDTTALTYRIVFKEDNGEIKGYSLTDFGGEHETKSTIVGTYDANAKKLEFSETDIIYTKSIFVKNDFCFISMPSTKFKLGKTKSFKTPFLGKFKDGEKCINGELFLNSLERVEKVVSKVSKKINKSKRVNDSLKEQFNNVKVMDSLRTNILKKNQTTSFFTTNNQITLTVYDGAKIDNDIITIYVNDKIKLYKHKSSDEVKTITIPLTEQITRIAFFANTIGTIGTNTTVVNITDGKNTIKALTDLKKEEQTMVNIIKLK